MRLLYTFNIHVYGLLIRIASLFNPKAKKWMAGRRGWKAKLAEAFAEKKPTIWFHCASLGEFEQGRPLMERLKKEQPETRILLSFFSPSGYEIRKNYAGADVIVYLPLDTKANARAFLDIVRPEKVFFVKYEFWFNFLGELQQRKIPHYLVSAIFRPSQHFFKSYGSWFRKALKGFEHIFTQTDESLQLLKNAGIANCSFAGDTRFDRVAEIASQARQIPIAEKFSGENRNVIIAGSTWPADEEKLIPALAEARRLGWKLLIAPHELGENHLASIEKTAATVFTASQIIRFSRAEEKNIHEAEVLIIDNIGMLSSLYRYGKIAYIGGGFGTGIHNILEAAVYGMPVIFGPRHEKFNEAREMLRTGGAQSFSNQQELEKIISQFITSDSLLKEKSQLAGAYVKNGCGATEKIFRKIFSY